MGSGAHFATMFPYSIAIQPSGSEREAIKDMGADLAIVTLGPYERFAHGDTLK